MKPILRTAHRFLSQIIVAQCLSFPFIETFAGFIAVRSTVNSCNDMNNFGKSIGN